MAENETDPPVLGVSWTAPATASTAPSGAASSYSATGAPSTASPTSATFASLAAKPPSASPAAPLWAPLRVCGEAGFDLDLAPVRAFPSRTYPAPHHVAARTSTPRAPPAWPSVRRRRLSGRPAAPNHLRRPGRHAVRVRHPALRRRVLLLRHQEHRAEHRRLAPDD